MDKSVRTRNAKRNILSILLNKVVALGLAFVTRTALIYSLGSLYLGLNGLFTSILQILSLAELGFGSAMVFSLYEPLAKDDRLRICALLNLYRRIYRAIGVVILFAGLTLMPFLPKLIKGETPTDVNLYILYLINLFNTVVSYFLYAYKNSLLIANQRTDLTGLISTGMNILSNLLQIAALCFFHNFYAYTLINPIITVATNLLNNRLANRLYPAYQCEGEPETETVNDIKKRVFGLFVYKICGVFRSSAGSVILSAFLGLNILAKYNNYFYILNSVSLMLSMMPDSITAVIGNAVAVENEEKNYRDFRLILLLYLGLSGLCTVLLFNLYQPFMRLWVGEDLMFNEQTMSLFCVFFFVQQIGVICFVYRQAIGLWWQDRIRPVVEALLIVTFNLILVKRFDVIGVLLSTVVVTLGVNTGWGAKVLFRCYFRSQSMRGYFGRLLLYCLGTFAACWSSHFLCGLHSFSGISGLLVNVLISMPCFVLLFLFPVRILPEFSDALSLFKRFLISRTF